MAAAQIARGAADAVTAARPAPAALRRRRASGRPNRTASLSPDVNNPGFRAVTFDELVEAYYEQARGLVDGGVDILLPETTFDTLNLKAALFAIEKSSHDSGIRLPVMVSVTITDASGRTLSGQTVEACWNSISHAPLLTVGINCALGAKEMRPHIEELAAIAPVFISAATRTPACRTRSASTTRRPQSMAALLREFAENGWLNIVGGCCGTTPDHIRAIADAVRELPPRVPPTVEPRSAAQRPRSRSTVRPELELHHGRRAHEHHRLAEVRAADQGRRFRRRAGHRQAADRRRRATSSTSTWTKGCSTPRRR